MKRLTRAQLFAQAKRMRRNKDWFERAKLVVLGARSRGRDCAATWGAVDEALSYRVAEAPLG
jgi:hypothetical protein